MSKPQDRDCVILRAMIDKAREDMPATSYAQGYFAGVTDSLAAIIEPPDGYPGQPAPSAEEETK